MLITQLYSSRERGLLTSDQLSQTLDELIWPNLEITIDALAWILVHLAANPSIQCQLRDEISSTKSSSPNNNKDALYEYLSSTSTHLHACVLESARLHPAAAFSIPQAAPVDHVLDSYLIPTGTNFIVDAYALNVDNEIWGADREEFRPERWQELERSNKSTRYVYWRFGFGPRQCMGKYVVDLILKVRLPIFSFSFPAGSWVEAYENFVRRAIGGRQGTC